MIYEVRRSVSFSWHTATQTNKTGDSWQPIHQTETVMAMQNKKTHSGRIPPSIKSVRPSSEFFVIQVRAPATGIGRLLYKTLSKLI